MCIYNANKQSLLVKTIFYMENIGTTRGVQDLSILYFPRNMTLLERNGRKISLKRFIFGKGVDGCVDTEEFVGILVLVSPFLGVISYYYIYIVYPRKL
jgi:hypothetical protein